MNAEVVANLAAVAQFLGRAVRILVATAFFLSLVIALTHWFVRGGKLSPFGAWARFVRRWGDRVLRPVEIRVVRSGGNPQDAPWWLLAVAVVAGLLLITVVDWFLEFLLGVAFSMLDGQGLGFILVTTGFNLLLAAMLIRVISSWLSVSPYSKWMRPVFVLTDWMILPIRRLLPSAGMFDFSPMVAIFLLYLVRDLLLRTLYRG